MRASTIKELATMKERIYELQRDLSMYLDDEQDELLAIPDDEYERAEEIVTALKDAVDNLEEAMNNIQIAID